MQKNQTSFIPFRNVWVRAFLVTPWSRIHCQGRRQGSIPDPGRSHVPWSDESHVPQLSGLRSRARSHRHWAHDCWSPRSAQPTLHSREAITKRSPHTSRQEPHRTAATGSPGAATKTQNSQRWVNKQKLSKNIPIRNDRERQCSCSVIKNSKKKRKLNPMHNNSGCNLNQRESKF